MNEQIIIWDVMSYLELHDFEDIYDRECDIVQEIVDDFHKENPPLRQRWGLIPADRLAKIMRDHVTHRCIRDEKGLVEIVEVILDNIAKLHVNTILCGHAMCDPMSYIAEYLNEDDDEEKFNKFTDEYLLDDESGCYRISDYALAPLTELGHKMVECKDPEALLELVDQVLNICHQRSDMSSWFVRGGQRKLTELSNMVA